MKMSKAQCEARAAAFEEAADHLTLLWTDDECEMAQGKIAAAFMQRQAEKWYSEALKRK